jgi:hypothetical protein
MSQTIQGAGHGNLDNWGEVLTVSAHELEHAKRREDESVFAHTRDFYQAVEDTILSIDPNQIAVLM